MLKRLTGRGENIRYRFTDIIFLRATRLRKMNPLEFKQNRYLTTPIVLAVSSI